MKASELEYKGEYLNLADHRKVAFVFQQGKRYWFTNISVKKPKVYYGDFWINEKQVENLLEKI